MENLQVVETIEVRLSDVCRSCLIKTDHMSNFFSKNDASPEIIAMLSSVGNFEIEINDYLPLYLCRSCEEKLRSSYDFQLLIQRSNEIIRQCLNGTNVVTEQEEQTVENTVSVSDSVVEETDDEDETIKPKQATRLLQFAPEEVERAIEQSKTKPCTRATCIKCGFNSDSSRALSVHMAILHKELRERWCSHCNAEVDDLAQHKEAHLHDSLKCEFCDRTFTALSRLIEHLRSHSSVKPFKCCYCSKGFISKRHRNKHLETHTNQRPYKCQLCTTHFRGRQALRLHLQNYHTASESFNEGPEQLLINQFSIPQNFCNICKKKVRSLTDHWSKTHQQSLSSNECEKDKLLCTTCGRQFRTSTQLRSHMRTHTGEVPYKCSYCDKRTSSRNQLIVHERIHTGEKPHICNFCGKGFTQSSVLNTHMKIHTGRPEVCDICFKRFCRPSQLRLHMRKHTGEKPFACTKCQQAFKQRSHLTEHIKTHSDERPYKCNYCDKGFKQNSSLKTHVQIHLGNKPFKCSQCPYACRQSYSLTQHMKQHSMDTPEPEKPHLCSSCQKGFSTVAMLRSHINNTHNATMYEVTS